MTTAYEQNLTELRAAIAAIRAKSEEIYRAKYPITFKRGAREGQIRPNSSPAILAEIARLQAEYNALAEHRMVLLAEHHRLAAEKNSIA